MKISVQIFSILVFFLLISCENERVVDVDVSFIEYTVVEAELVAGIVGGFTRWTRTRQGIPTIGTEGMACRVLRTAVRT